MTADDRRRALTYLTAAAVLTLVISTALPRLAFQPGLPLPQLASEQISVVSSPDQPPVGAPAGLFFRVLILLALTAFLAYMGHAVAASGLWREALRRGVPVLFILLAVIGLLSLAVVRLPPAAVAPAPQGSDQVAQPEALVPVPLGAPPPWLIWLLGGVLIGSALVLAFLAWQERRRWLGRKAWQAEAERARKAILAGDDLGDVIMRCYLRMGAALQAERGIERAPSMTTGDFERLLAAHGVPQEPVHELTRLYEAVRYGRRRPGPGDETQALQSLDAILQHSRAAARDG